MRKHGKAYDARTIAFLIVQLVSACVLAASCAKYAPQAPAAPQRRLLEITLTTNADIAPGYYYYIAMDTSGDPATDGPHTTLSGAEVVKNWSYFIVIKDGIFSECCLPGLMDVTKEPTSLSLSSRFYSAQQAGKNIVVRLYLDQLTATPTIWFNFITSTAPPTNDPVYLPALDYLTNPSFSVITTGDINVTNSVFPAISGHVAPVGSEAADIVSWRVRVYGI